MLKERILKSYQKIWFDFTHPFSTVKQAGIIDNGFLDKLYNTEPYCQLIKENQIMINENDSLEETEKRANVYCMLKIMRLNLQDLFRASG